MIKYEKLNTKEELLDGKAEIVQSYEEVKNEEEADYVHICGHNKNPPEPCRRIRKEEWLKLSEKKI